MSAANVYTDIFIAFKALCSLSIILLLNQKNLKNIIFLINYLNIIES